MRIGLKRAVGCNYEKEWAKPAEWIASWDAVDSSAKRSKTCS